AQASREARGEHPGSGSLALRTPRGRLGRRALQPTRFAGQPCHALPRCGGHLVGFGGVEKTPVRRGSVPAERQRDGAHLHAPVVPEREHPDRRRLTHARRLDPPVPAVTRDVDHEASVPRRLVRQAERIEEPAPESVLDDPLVDGPRLEVLEPLLGCRHPRSTLGAPADASRRCAARSHTTAGHAQTRDGASRRVSPSRAAMVRGNVFCARFSTVSSARSSRSGSWWKSTSFFTRAASAVARAPAQVLWPHPRRSSYSSPLYIASCTSTSAPRASSISASAGRSVCSTSVA